jgi:hypothetical protein
MIFTDGGAFTWRNGDTSDAATGVKCMIEQASACAPSAPPPVLTLHGAGWRPCGKPSGRCRADQQLELRVVSMPRVRARVTSK